MKICSYCNGDSPIEALYCINCGALFQEMTGSTYKLYPTPISIETIYKEYGIPNPTIRLSKRQILGLKNNIETIGGDLYLSGHRIIPID